jgi:acetyl esterase
VAGAVLAMRDDRKETPRSVVLAYGALHSRIPDDAEIESSLRGPLARWFFNPAMTRRMNLNYVGAVDNLARAYAFPGGADLRGFPPTLVLDASNDRLRRSGHAFAGELQHAGSRVDEVVVNGRHGFLNSPRRAAFATGMSAIARWLAY